MELICQYCKNPIKQNEAYQYEGLGGMIKNQKGIVAWHYSCDKSEHEEVIKISTKLKIELVKHLFTLKEGWAKRVIEACGYHE